MDNAKVPENYRELFERAVMGPITKRDLEGTSVHARLRLIGTVRDALFDQASPGSPSIQHLNLMTIENTFKASERFCAWQDKRRAVFLNEIGKREHSGLRKVFSSWRSQPMSERKRALIQTSTMHQHAYMSGVADVLPVQHRFHASPAFNVGGRIVMTFGGFRGDFVNRRGYLRHNTGTGSFLFNAQFTLETNHHETTHALQFMLADAFRRKTIREDHMLYEEARVFSEIDRLSGVLPAALGRAYEAQLHERLAESEGVEIAEAIMEMSR